MTPKQSQVLNNAHIILKSYQRVEEEYQPCVSEVKAQIAELLAREEARDESRSKNVVVDLLRSVRAELARHFADAEAPRPSSRAALH